MAHKSIVIQLQSLLEITHPFLPCRKGCPFTRVHWFPEGVATSCVYVNEVLQRSRPDLTVAVHEDL